MDYIYDTDIEQKYDIGGHALFLYRAVREVIPTNSVVLDVGCNSGAIGRLLMQEKNVICYGVDVNPQLVIRAINKGIFAKLTYFSKGIFEKPGVAEKLPWPDNNFDAVILLEILEHVYDADKVLKEATRVTKLGGIITGSVPHPKGQAGAKGFVKHKYHARVVDKTKLKKLLGQYLKKIEIKNIYTDPDITGLPNWLWFSGKK